MTDSGGLILQVQPGPHDDAEELAELAESLRDELLDLDVTAVTQLLDGAVPVGAKGVAAVAGWLAVQLGPETLRTVLAKIAGWAARSDRTVKLTIGGDSLEVTGASREQQERIIDDWFARHPAGA